MRSLRHTTRKRGVIQSRVLLVFLLASQIGLAGCRHPGARAHGVTRKGVASLRIGSSREQVLAALGTPLSEGSADGKDILTYAFAGEWYVGSRTLWHGGGQRFIIELKGGRLESAYLSDSGMWSSTLCVCTPTTCPATWANGCLPALPE
jgi:hypothetical protein